VKPFWKNRQFWRFVVLALIGVTTAVIWRLSLVPAGESSRQSEQIVVPVVAATQQGGDFFDYLFIFVRKMAHFIEFFGLGLLWGLYNKLRPRPLPFVWLYGLGVGVLDELLQGLAPGRAPGMMDVVLDYCGYFCGFALVFAAADWYWRRKKRKQRK